MLDRIPTVQQFQKKLFKKMEDGFMELAKKIEKRPKLTIFLSLLVCVAPSPGLIRLNYEQEAIKLWNSEASDTRINHDWLMKVYPPDTRYHSIIFKAENVLKPDVLYTMYQVHRIILETRSKNNITWASSCQKVPVIMDPSLWKSSNGSNIYSSINVSTALSVSVDLYPDIYCAILDSFTSACLELSILELFARQGEYQEKDFLSKLLGGITYDRNGRIIGARTAQMGLVARVDKQELRDFPVSDSIEVTSSQVLEFEYSLIESLLAGNYTQGVQVYPNIQLSFGEVSNRIALKDCYNFIPGVILQFIYLFISVRRPWFVLAGLATVGFATLATISIASIASISFTSLSLILPLLLLGIKAGYTSLSLILPLLLLGIIAGYTSLSLIQPLLLLGIIAGYTSLSLILPLLLLGIKAGYTSLSLILPLLLLGIIAGYTSLLLILPLLLLGIIAGYTSLSLILPLLLLGIIVG
ncbi:uncharacterized protein LOC111699903 isoform X2 [Eurytemora carolleeae]|uniref:uncharacterized protein LOC111699903 isoform X2 n=1 Tax=Eurytemora carolleeae TaxID=1294199 RepID=UPI000C78BBD3|nr:uncharacterized protein LOC111699903 isoform X2 [Eurytemora carolleeae]|eukprot:XP_023326434.1 uncharacterized protein LOC111699903 isoform X2 [Eurytemora affinis]